ncbi:hypothetical protein KTT_49130 [Tengunoibacter tsumagoiensis]|uniref:Uncharacterized protein n=1 Tax=Tengunoibacter tsumagoiensis TaxID=2014871 RepID=A0A402A7C1_9CHLR|nr:hypothetical protein KTT_49130 [Tengunoibacter tsumagoiensis]
MSVCTNIHDSTEFFANEWGRAIWTNSALKYVMKQNSSTISTVTEMLGLSLGERRHLLSC